MRERLALSGVSMTETRFDLIGIDALHGDARTRDGDPYEVRIRVVGRTDSLPEARRIGEEVETLYTNRPAAGGGAWKSARQLVAVASALIPENAVQTAGPWRRPDAHETAGDRAFAHRRQRRHVQHIGDRLRSRKLSAAGRAVTVERVAAHFARVATGRVRRYELPNVGALNFVLEGALAGGVTRALTLDADGKSLSSPVVIASVARRSRDRGVSRLRRPRNDSRFAGEISTAGLLRSARKDGPA